MEKSPKTKGVAKLNIVGRQEIPSRKTWPWLLQKVVLFSHFPPLFP